MGKKTKNISFMRKAGPLMRETFIPQLFVTIFRLGHKLWDMDLNLDPSVVELTVF
jgi:hypothetical protein